MSEKCLKCQKKMKDEPWYEDSPHIEQYARYLGYCSKHCYYKEDAEKRTKREWGAILSKLWKRYDNKPRSLSELGKTLNLQKGLLEKNIA